MSEPRGMYDMTGWSLIDCVESDRIRSEHTVTVASSLTDPSGVYSSGVVFSEWWAGDEPLLRDYRWTAEDRPCEHFVAIFGESAATP